MTRTVGRPVPLPWDELSVHMVVNSKTLQMQLRRQHTDLKSDSADGRGLKIWRPLLPEAQYPVARDWPAAAAAAAQVKWYLNCRLSTWVVLWISGAADRSLMSPPCHGRPWPHIYPVRLVTPSVACALADQPVDDRLWGKSRIECETNENEHLHQLYLSSLTTGS